MEVDENDNNEASETKELFLLKDELFKLEGDLRSKIRKVNQDLLELDVLRMAPKAIEEPKLKENPSQPTDRELELQSELENVQRALNETILEVKAATSQLHEKDDEILYLQSELRELHKKNHSQMDSMKKKLVDTREYLDSLQREKSQLQQTVEKWQDKLLTPEQTPVKEMPFADSQAFTPIISKPFKDTRSPFADSVYSPDIELDKLLLSSRYSNGLLRTGSKLQELQKSKAEIERQKLEILERTKPTPKSKLQSYQDRIREALQEN